MTGLFISSRWAAPRTGSTPTAWITCCGSGGWRPRCPAGAEARVLIVNTCGFLGAARAESVGAIEELLQTRRDGQVVIAAGCMPALGNYQDDIPAGVDHVLTTREWYRIGDVVGDLLGEAPLAGSRRLRGDADDFQPGGGGAVRLRQDRRRLRP